MGRARAGPSAVGTLSTTNYDAFSLTGPWQRNFIAELAGFFLAGKTAQNMHSHIEIHAEQVATIIHTPSERH